MSYPDDQSAVPAREGEATDHDIDFFWDPLCPFCWITSRWVEQLVALRGLRVNWRFISLAILNRDNDMSPERRSRQALGLQTSRVAAAVKAELGNEALRRFITAYGESVWDGPPGSERRPELSTPEHLREVLATAGLPTGFADSLADTSRDALLQQETDLGLARTGPDVGTPIITWGPPDGPSFFGPVISRVPSDEDAVRLWDALTVVATFDSFAELKRTLREPPQLNALNGEG